MALNLKYAALPDLDTSSRDTYETPDLTDDVSTVPTNTDFDEEEDTPDITRARLRINDARSRFEPAKVDARDVNFSDRLDSKRKSYKVSSRRRRISEHGTEELGDLSDAEEEKLERKVARLKRELEEVKDEIGKRSGGGDQVSASIAEVATLSSALDKISLPSSYHYVEKPAASSQPQEQGQTGDQDGTAANVQPARSATYTITYGASYQQSHALMKAADFDKRLLELERAIGLGSPILSELESDGLPRAIIPMLDNLQKQIGILRDASGVSLDTISRRARTLAQEAENLAKARLAAKQARESRDDDITVTAEVTDQTTKINTLYSTLPTIENLAPLLPPLLDRLRSLRTIHAEAAKASETLDYIEKRHGEMTEDINQWKAGLEKVEIAMADGSDKMQKNKEVIEGWVNNLEMRLNALE